MRRLYFRIAGELRSRTVGSRGTGEFTYFTQNTKLRNYNNLCVFGLLAVSRFRGLRLPVAPLTLDRKLKLAGTPGSATRREDAELRESSNCRFFYAIETG